MAAEMERDEYMRVVSTSAEDAMRFAGVDQRPVDLGPADPSRYREGARVWGFRRDPKTAAERAAVAWGQPYGSLTGEDLCHCGMPEAPHAHGGQYCPEATE